MLILDSLKSILNGYVLNLDENSSTPFGIFGGVDDLDFSFYYELIRVIHHACKITIMHKVPPR
jgi:hypothetical protein